jgi:hypothetical protein
MVYLKSVSKLKVFAVQIAEQGEEPFLIFVHYDSLYLEPANGKSATESPLDFDSKAVAGDCAKINQIVSDSYLAFVKEKDPELRNTTLIPYTSGGKGRGNQFINIIATYLYPGLCSLGVGNFEKEQIRSGTIKSWPQGLGKYLGMIEHFYVLGAAGKKTVALFTPGIKRIVLENTRKDKFLMNEVQEIGNAKQELNTMINTWYRQVANTGNTTVEDLKGVVFTRSGVLCILNFSERAHPGGFPLVNAESESELSESDFPENYTARYLLIPYSQANLYFTQDFRKNFKIISTTNQRK